MTTLSPVLGFDRLSSSTDRSLSMKRASPSSPSDPVAAHYKKPRAGGTDYSPATVASTASPYQYSAAAVSGDATTAAYYDYSTDYSATYGDASYFGAGSAVASSSAAPVPHYNPQHYAGGTAAASTVRGNSMSGDATGGVAGAEAGNRTVWVGNLPAGTTVEQLLDQVHHGALESAKIVAEKSCAFVVFLDAHDAANFWHAAPVPPHIQAAVAAGATRNVYISNLAPTTTEDELRFDLAQYGEIDNVRIVPPREPGKGHMGFVHFCALAAAMKVVASLGQTNPKYANRRINYGKDRCVPRHANGGGGGHMVRANSAASAFGYGSPAAAAAPTAYTQQQQQHQAHPAPYYQFGAPSHGAPVAFGGTQLRIAEHMVDPTFAYSNNLAYLPPDAHLRMNAPNNRNVYIGGLPEDAIPEDVCNVIRAGLIDKISMLPNKACAFITFIDPQAATLIYYLADTYGMVIRGRRVKLGWGRPSAPPLTTVATAVRTAGATRNVYIGPLPQWLLAVGANAAAAHEHLGGDVAMGESLDDQAPYQGGKASSNQPQQAAIAAELLVDFATFGDIEVIHVLVDKQCAFINYMDIRGAIRAIAEAPVTLANKYGTCRIGYGKDRCAGPIRMPNEAGLPIGGMIPRRATGSFTPAAAMAAATGMPVGAGGFPAEQHHQHHHHHHVQHQLPPQPPMYPQHHPAQQQQHAYQPSHAGYATYDERPSSASSSAAVAAAAATLPPKPVVDASGVKTGAAAAAHHAAVAAAAASASASASTAASSTPLGPQDVLELTPEPEDIEGL
ncbi:hypothetical protein AMAG_05299 [Allomyces macrogynus ATCC 38327]|uniref:RRM domain-containing protein n=1 Tax=Allomyces macrogynus (strain ATCC 38327) TaxID=578462 RepID=A0A0L0SBJ0_ALLM3|nr:hypothetical protein AMAG_05299 [Allomyces macrogynus ATCC 38327]|eukprot:KNE59846.1 hypothetical protein AMAG_05299 [Allomyces macrogynus ATCC 38327]